MAENQEDENEDVDPFALENVFGDPQKLLDHECKNLEEIKDEAIVCLDANVLLLPYEFSGTSLQALISVYEKLGKAGNLKIPSRAAKEYLKHRADKITEIDKALSDHKSVNRKCLSQINFMEGNKDLKEIRDFEKEIASLEKKVSSRIDKLSHKLNAETGSDPVSRAYRPVFKNAVVELNDFDKDGFLDDLAYRYKNKIPPGFKDSNKPDKGVGDLLIWKTVLQIGRAIKKDLIFVTADAKGDWWTKRGNSERARLELVEEYRAASSGCSFYLLKPSELLQLYGASATEVESVRNVESEFALSMNAQMAEVEKEVHYVQSREYGLRNQRRTLFNKIEAMRSTDGEYIPEYLMRELHEVELELSHSQNAHRRLRSRRNEIAHGGVFPGAEWQSSSRKNKQRIRCTNCGGRKFTLNPDRQVACSECGKSS